MTEITSMHNTFGQHRLRALLAPALAWLMGAHVAPALAHDTWFAPAPAEAGAGALALGTGTLYPKHEFAVGPEYLARQGCRAGQGPVQPLRPLRITDTALLLSAPAPGTSTCWAQLQAFEIDITSDKVAVYFDEIRPPAALRQRLAEQQSRGVAWHERYTKHARTLLASAPGASGAPVTDSFSADMDLDARLAPGQGAPRVGQTVVFQVLSAGLPLPGLAVQLRSELSPLGFWAQTDADGKVAMRVPLAGRWLLRGTELKPSATRTDGWDSRFITLAFDVAR